MNKRERKNLVKRALGLALEKSCWDFRDVWGMACGGAVPDDMVESIDDLDDAMIEVINELCEAGA